MWLIRQFNSLGMIISWSSLFLSMSHALSLSLSLSERQHSVLRKDCERNARETLEGAPPSCARHKARTSRAIPGLQCPIRAQRPQPRRRSRRRRHRHAGDHRHRSGVVGAVHKAPRQKAPGPPHGCRPPPEASGKDLCNGSLLLPLSLRRSSASGWHCPPNSRQPSRTAARRRH